MSSCFVSTGSSSLSGTALTLLEEREPSCSHTLSSSSIAASSIAECSSAMEWEEIWLETAELTRSLSTSESSESDSCRTVHWTRPPSTVSKHILMTEYQCYLDLHAVLLQECCPSSHSYPPLGDFLYSAHLIFWTIVSITTTTRVAQYHHRACAKYLLPSQQNIQETKYECTNTIKWLIILK